jgi:rare lipoprotein A
MKYINTIIFFLLMSFTGCSSSVKFTAEEKANNKPKSHSRYEGENKEEEKSNNNLPELSEEKKEVEQFPLTISDETILESSTGVASYYAKKFHGRKTASGEKYDMNEYTAAHGRYPFNTVVKVTNLSNNKSVKVRINDRKPSLHGRLIDVSYAAAKELDFIINGIAQVQVDVISWGDPAIK